MNGRKGIVFFTTLVLLTMIVFICSAIAIVILRDAYTTKRMKYNMQAYFLAEAGIEQALKEVYNNFDYVPSGLSTNLGNGSYLIAITTYALDPSRKLISSTGTVKGVPRTIKVQVKYTGPEAFNYPAMGGGKLTISGDSIISNSGPISVHSNSPGNKAVEVGDANKTGTVIGNASACGTVSVHPTNGTVTGAITDKNSVPPASYVELPPFDDNFFQYYYNLANADGKVYRPGWPLYTKIFTSNPCTGPNHVVYVDGHARIVGTWEMTGCIVATKKIIINQIASGRITQHQWQNLPAFMSKGQDVEIYDPTDIEGMVYANGFIWVDSIWGTYGPTTIYGTLYGKSWVNIKNKTLLHYRRPNPPGLPAGTVAIKALSWSD